MDSIQTFFLFIQDQILGMKWLNSLIKNLLTALNVDVDGRLGGSIQFFIYDVLKITILLCFLIFIISYIQSYFPPERSKKILGRFHGVGSYIISALLGTVTPFCSCSSIPLFIGFTSAGLPLGVTFSFLISSPMVDLGSLVLLMSIFGAKIAIAYVIVGLMIAVAGGALIDMIFTMEMEVIHLDSIQTFFLFIQDQILGMKWLNSLIKNLLTALNVDVDGRLGGSIQFFIYDVLKITILLCFLIFIISYIQSYFPPERSKKILGRFHGVGSYIISALLGTVTPFCSCSSIPLFIGFTSAGLPLGVTFSFLISSPMVDLGSLVLLMSIFGAKIAIAYVIVGLMIAVAGGALIEKLHMEKYVEEFIKSANGIDMDAPALTRKDRLYFAREQVTETFKKVFPYILVGVGIGAAIHNWIPESWIQSILGSNNPFGVILATLVGIPMYADIFGTIPVAEALLAKGAQLGTILAFMMAVTTLSLPSMIMLKKAVKPKLLTLFIVICTTGIILVGYLFNVFHAFFI